jgi:hypothetical protein
MERDSDPALSTSLHGLHVVGELVERHDPPSLTWSVGWNPTMRQCHAGSTVNLNQIVTLPCSSDMDSVSTPASTSRLNQTNGSAVPRQWSWRPVQRVDGELLPSHNKS